MGSPSTSGYEREVKLDLDDEVELPDLAGLLRVADAAMTLTARYWDTADRRLLASGVTLRHRAADDGSEEGWTVKLPMDSGRGGTRREVTCGGEPVEPPPGLRALLRGLTRSEPLRPVATLVTTRRAVRWADDTGRELLEVDDDRVEASVANDEPAEPYRQIEVELLHGSEDDLANAVAQLTAHGARRSADTSKLARALSAGGPTEQPGEPPSGASGRGDVRALLAATIGRATGRLLANDPLLRLGDDPEALHQARVATRRLRSDLQTLAPLLRPASVQRLRGELRWAAQLLGAVRDVDVLAGRLSGQLEGFGDDRRGAAVLLARLEDEAQLRRLVLADALAGRRYLDLLDDLVAATADPPLAEGTDGERPGFPVLAAATGRAWKRLERATKGAGAGCPDEQLHEIRKRAKRARYAAELVARSAGGAGKGASKGASKAAGAASRRSTRGAAKLADRLADLQDALGELQDAATAREWLDGLDRARLSVDEAFVAGRLVAVQDQLAAEARRAWQPVWERAAKRKLRAWLP